MILRKKIQFAGVLALLGIWGITGHISAKENVGGGQRRPAFKTTAEGGCLPATAAIDLDINNVRARLMTGGDMWWNIGSQVAAYEIPKNSGKSSQFAASCWIGGYDQQGQLKVAAQTYRQDGNDYWPGSVNDLGKITKDTCDLWDRFWKVDRSTINQFIQLHKTNGQAQAMGKDYAVINEWPATGNSRTSGRDKVFGTRGRDGDTRLTLKESRSYAPFKDLNTDGVYQPEDGEYPLITGDQYIWWVFNDAGNTKQQSITASMGIEVQTSAFAYATQDFLNDATFCQYRVINRGALTIDSTYIAVWDDLDLGYYNDDYIGCDTTRGLGISYNGTNDDGGNAGHPVNSYGLNPPQVGLDFFQGPLKPVTIGGKDTVQRLGMTNFTYYNNDNSIIGNPSNGIQIYFYMTGSIRTGQRFSYDFTGAGQTCKGYGSGTPTNFVYWGDPGDNSQWSECACNNNPADRRFIFSSGPFQLLPGAMNDIVFGCVWAKSAGGCGATSFKTIKSIDDQAQGLFDNKFKTVEGPEAPRMVVRELDRKLVFYLVNDYGSNNYGENYGRTDGAYNDSLLYHQLVVKATGKADSLYKFEGYRVFQLANSQVTSAEIFNPITGEVDNTKAYEVFQCDLRNGVKQIVNYGSNINVDNAGTFPMIKVNGRDSGISHSFVLTNDQFSTSPDKQFINYHSYYFVAVAYSYNNFTKFDPLNINSTQDVAYLGSSHGAGGTEIKVVVAIPNPANGAMGTVLNSDFGSGITVTRLEGVGNGGNDVRLSDSSEAEILKNNTATKLVYRENQGPVKIKVVDPVKVPAYDWVLQVLGPNTASGISDTGRWMLTAYDGNTKVNTIYAERNLGSINEQILEDYGLSVNVNQAKADRGQNQTNNNDYIFSEITFDETSKPWLGGVTDQADSNFANWIRSGNTQKYTRALHPLTNPCFFNDSKLDTVMAYANLLDNFAPAKSTWAPYNLVAAWQGYHAGTGTQCGFQFALAPQTQTIANFQLLPDVDVVLTSDKTKWTKCAVIEMQEDPALSEGYVGKTNAKFLLREHAGWSDPFQVAADNMTPIYSDDDSERGMSWFPGYAIDPTTGKRLNIAFGEDSYLSGNNGNDMVWNPTSNIFNFWDGSLLFGGKHAIYVLGTTYDSCKQFARSLRVAAGNPGSVLWRNAYAAMQWVGVPIVNPEVPLKSLKDGLIPTGTRLRFRVNQAYAPYYAVADTSAATLRALPAGAKATNPYYTFSTSGLAPTPVTDKTDKGSVLNRIYAVPNPYFGYSGYETNRFETKVRIINLPARVTVHIYSLDGALVRTLTKNDPNTPYLDWDVRNTVGLPIASGMYIMNIKAEGLGETVLKWFGAMRPIDVTTY
ncbi:MAG: hypothetical protein K0Q79_2884 [Flavipsychrobacter sp.]|jgi:hypothetical protein|nr:hypothetical protein [Flavipsychrobacter sp.]